MQKDWFICILFRLLKTPSDFACSLHTTDALLMPWNSAVYSCWCQWYELSFTEWFGFPGYMFMYSHLLFTLMWLHNCCCSMAELKRWMCATTLEITLLATSTLRLVRFMWKLSIFHLHTIYVFYFTPLRVQSIVIEDAACDLNIIVKGEGLLKISGGRVHWKNDNIS